MWPSSYYVMEACYKETTKWIKIYIPTGRTGGYDYNSGSGTECKKIIINKENNKVSTAMTFVRHDEEEKFLKKVSKEEMKDEIYAIYAKHLLLGVHN